MQKLVLLLIPLIVLTEGVVQNTPLPGSLRLLPDLLAGIALLLVIKEVATKGTLYLSGGFALLIGLILVSIGFGLIAAQSEIGPIISGLRTYGHFVPFFLIPLVYKFEERELKIQLVLLLALLLLQFPVTVMQRFVWFAGLSGDFARGTVATGSFNAMVLLIGLAVLIGATIKGLIRRSLAIACGFLIFLTPTIAEVKGAFLLSPIALLAPFIAAPRSVVQIRHIVLAGGLSLFGLAVFGGMFYLTESTHKKVDQGIAHETNILKFLTDPEALINYMAPKLGGDINTGRVGRLDSVIEPFKEFSDEPMRYLTGLGFGALTDVSVDVFAPSKEKLAIVEKRRAWVTISMMIWELGLLCTTLFLIGLYATWRYALRLREAPGIYGALALGWSAAVPIFFLSMFYKNTILNVPMMYLFCFYSAVIIAEEYRVRMGKLASAGGLLSTASTKPGEPEQIPGSRPVSISTPELPPILNSAPS